MTVAATATTNTPRLGVESPVVRAGALALVSAATALGFARVFSNGGFVPLLLMAAVLPHLVGLVGRIRQWTTVRTALVATLTMMIGLLWIIAGETTTYGLPTSRSAARLGHLLDAGWAVFRTGVAPVAPRTGVVLLCAIAVAISAISADAIARRPEVTIGALSPTLVLFVLTGTLGTGDLRVPTTIAYIAAALVALVVANAARVAQRRTWFTGRRLVSNATVVRSAAFVGGIAVLVGLVLTPLIPGVDSPALLRYRNHTGQGGTGGLGNYQTVSPLVDLRSRLGERSDVELFRVASPRALYWRLMALDRFDGQVWSVTSEARDAAAAFRGVSERHAVAQQFSITGLDGQWVPAAFTPVDTTMGNARIIPDSATLIAPNPIGGQQYEVRSRVEVDPTPAQIAATVRPVPAALHTALELPSDFPAAIRSQAREITAGATTPYAEAQALQRFFTEGFVYDLNVPPTDDTEAIGAFLRLRRGFCQQFAATFAALARANGLPSRVVVGFTPGDIDPVSGEYIVRGRNAHAWAEVWFAGLGWRTFEPTPAGSAPGQADTRAGPGLASGPPDSANSTPTTIARTSPTTGGGATSGPRRIPKSETVISTRGTTPSTGWDSRSVALVALPILLVGAFGVFLGTRLFGQIRTRRRRRRAVEPTTRIAGAWRDALEACAGAGLPVSVALTPREQARAISRQGAPSDAVPPLRDLAELSTDIEFSPHEPDAAAIDRAWAAAEDVRAALLVGVGPRERAQRALRTSFGRVTDFDDEFSNRL